MVAPREAQIRRGGGGRGGGGERRESPCLSIDRTSIRSADMEIFTYFLRF